MKKVIGILLLSLSLIANAVIIHRTYYKIVISDGITGFTNPSVWTPNATAVGSVSVYTMTITNVALPDWTPAPTIFKSTYVFDGSKTYYIFEPSPDFTVTGCEGVLPIGEICVATITYNPTSYDTQTESLVTFRYGPGSNTYTITKVNDNPV